MKRKNAAQVLPILILALLGLGVLTAVFILVSTPSNAISVSTLPGGVSLNPTNKPAATVTPVATATAKPSVTSTAVPTEVTNIATATTLPATATPAPATATPEPTPTPEPEPTGINPARLRIPSIGVDAEVEKVGQTKQGAMDVPKSFWTVGWYELGTLPGKRGSAVMAGHLDSTKGPAIFWDLKKLTPGQKIYVADEEGHELVFEVTQTEVYNIDEVTFPQDHTVIDRIFSNDDDIHLNLITCNGIFDNRSANYNKRLVVYTKLIKEGA